MKTFKTKLLTIVALLCSISANAHDFEVDGIYYNITSETDSTVSVTFRGPRYDDYDNEYSGTITIPPIVNYNSNTYRVTSIGSSAFYDCKELTSITIPEGVTRIEYDAFSGCSSLTSITIPKSVFYISSGAFRDCCNISSMIVNAGNTRYDSRNGCNAIIETISNALLHGCSSTVIPEGVTRIEYDAFSGCSSLTSITIPEGVTSIGGSAFEGCSSLTSITIPEGVTSIGTYTFRGCSSLTSITIPEEVTSIGSSAFSGCSSLTSITIPEEVTSIGSSAFSGCSSLTSITIPEGVTSIGAHAFNGCSSLTSITIPEGVTFIRNNAFSDCSSLTSITIPEGVTSIGGSAFEGCSSLTSITIPEGVTSIGTYTFRGCSSLTSITIPEGVTSIEAYAFSGCSSLTSITIPEGVTSIEEHAFYGCSSLTSITIPEGVTSIGSSAFSNCRSLTSITIPEGVTSIEERAFEGCSSLTSITIPEGVTSIGSCAFYGCSSLTSITIPEGVTSIEEYAFLLCNLKDVYCNTETVPTTDGNVFDSSGHTNATLYVPTCAVVSYKSTYPWSKFGTIVSLTKYNLIYIVDKTEYKKYEIEYGRSITAEAFPVKEGHTFSGWSELPDTMPAHDVTVKGSFTVNRYRLTYMLDGEEYSVDSIAYGTELVQKDTLIKEGYTFSGWSEIPDTMPAKDVTVEGTFTVNRYRLTYMLDGEEYSVDSIAYGTELVQKEALIKEGYTFSAWSELPDTMPAHDVTVEGSFTVNRYRLTYMLDGEEYSVDSISYGTELVQKETLTKEGYTFSGWSEIPETMPAHDVTVKGSFTVNSYTLLYTVDGAEYKKVELEYGASITAEAGPAKEGYTFSGWSELPDTMPAHDVTINGFFTINSYTLTFILNGEMYQQENKLYGTQIKIIDVPQKEGYTFSGWGDVPSTMPAKDLMLVGSYIVNKHTVTYYVDNEIYTSFEVDYGSVLTTLTDLTKIGYTFSGWSEMPETMPDHDVIVTGTFSANKYAVIYTLNGEAYATDSVFYGKNIVIRPNPELEGHTFSGWSKTPETMPAHDVTIRGEFVINTYKLTYILDGEIYTTMQISYGSPIYLITDPVREGYTFSGWSEVPETMPAQDVTVTGSFTVNGINAVVSDKFVDVYTLQGTLIKRQIAVEELEHELPTGIYIVNGKKMFVR